MDIILDLWMNTVYNDEQVEGSEVGPVFYIRNGTGSPLISYADLAMRWGQSKASVGRLLKKLEDLEYLYFFSFPGRHGSVICLNSYLSTMFQISDIIIDKDEIALSLKIKVTIPENICADKTESGISTTQLSVSTGECSVSKTDMGFVVREAAKMLAALGLSCCECPKSIYKLSPLLDDCERMNYPQEVLQRTVIPHRLRFNLEVSCKGIKRAFLFELALTQPENAQNGGIYSDTEEKA